MIREKEVVGRNEIVMEKGYYMDEFDKMIRIENKKIVKQLNYSPKSVTALRGGMTGGILIDKIKNEKDPRRRWVLERSLYKKQLIFNKIKLKRLKRDLARNNICKLIKYKSVAEKEIDETQEMIVYLKKYKKPVM